jgi:alpha-tubulin suppressor-like RCC1 family protein
MLTVMYVTADCRPTPWPLVLRTAVTVAAIALFACADFSEPPSNPGAKTVPGQGRTGDSDGGMPPGTPSQPGQNPCGAGTSACATGCCKTAPPLLVRQMAVGDVHTCVITEAGAVKCWGGNINGLLGDNTDRSSDSPVEVASLGSGIVAIAAGAQHSCALTSAGGVLCWGGNAYGQLGNNNDVDSTFPVEVRGLAAGVIALAIGKDHTCALTSAGKVKCWGANYSAQLGTDSGVSSPIPVDVAGLDSVATAISASEKSTCALQFGGAVKCWGSNLNGELGGNQTTATAKPSQVFGLPSGVTQIVSGTAHSCAVTSNVQAAATVKCWGYNGRKQLGNNTKTLASNVPVDLLGLTGSMTRIGVLAAGEAYSCLTTLPGAVQCWGMNLGPDRNETKDDHVLPTEIPGLGADIVELKAGRAHACARTSAGVMKCWGDNRFGQLGDRSSRDSSVPVIVANGG